MNKSDGSGANGTTEGRRPSVSLLGEVQEGSTVEVVAFLANGRRPQRLAELGLTPGTSVRILRSAKSQPLLVSVRGTHLAIDRSTAALVRVRVLHTARRRRGWGRWRVRGRRGRHRRNCDPD